MPLTRPPLRGAPLRRGGRGRSGGWGLDCAGDCCCDALWLYLLVADGAPGGVHWSWGKWKRGDSSRHYKQTAVARSISDRVPMRHKLVRTGCRLLSFLGNRGTAGNHAPQTPPPALPVFPQSLRHYLRQPPSIAAPRVQSQPPYPLCQLPQARTDKSGGTEANLHPPARPLKSVVPTTAAEHGKLPSRAIPTMPMSLRQPETRLSALAPPQRVSSKSDPGRLVCTMSVIAHTLLRLPPHLAAEKSRHCATIATATAMCVGATAPSALRPLRRLKPSSHAVALPRC